MTIPSGEETINRRYIQAGPRAEQLNINKVKSSGCIQTTNVTSLPVILVGRGARLENYVIEAVTSVHEILLRVHYCMADLLPLPSDGKYL